MESLKPQLLVLLASRILDANKVPLIWTIDTRRDSSWCRLWKQARLWRQEAGTVARLRELIVIQGLMEPGGSGGGRRAEFKLRASSVVSWVSPAIVKEGAASWFLIADLEVSSWIQSFLYSHPSSPSKDFVSIWFLALSYLCLKYLD